MRAFKDQRITPGIEKKAFRSKLFFHRQPLRKKVWLRPFFIVAGVVIFVISLEFYYKDLSRRISRSISRVEIGTKLVRVSELDVKVSLRGLLGQGFFSLDVEKVKSQLEGNPWISAAVVTRVWPDTLYIELEEELQIARWGSQRLVNQYGELFSPKNVEKFTNLPSLAGRDGEERVVMRQYRSLSQVLASVELKLTGLRLDPRGGWTLALSGGPTIFAGRNEVLQKVQRFADFYAHQRGLVIAELETIDLRYSNGLAIQKRSLPKGSLNAKGVAAIN